MSTQTEIKGSVCSVENNLKTKFQSYWPCLHKDQTEQFCERNEATAVQHKREDLMLSATKAETILFLSCSVSYHFITLITQGIVRVQWLLKAFSTSIMPGMHVQVTCFLFPKIMQRCQYITANRNCGSTNQSLMCSDTRGESLAGCITSVAWAWRQ